MEIINRGDIYLAKLNNSVLSGTKPVVVIQNNISNSPNIIVAPVTSDVDRQLPTQVEISVDITGKAQKGLLLLERIRTLNKNSLIRRIGSLSNEETINVNRAIKYSFATYNQNKNNEAIKEAADTNVSAEKLANVYPPIRTQEKLDYIVNGKINYTDFRQ